MPGPFTARRPTWLSRNLLVLCGVSFLQDAASELLYPILPIFLTSVLGAPPAVVGAVEGVAEGTAAATKLVAGRIADRTARRPLIAAGYGLAAVGKLLVALAGIWPVVLAGRCVDRLGKGIRGAPRDALLVVGVPIEARGRAFGLHRAADTAGAVVGPLLGLAGYELLHHHIRPLLIIAVVPAVASVALVAAVREGPPPFRPKPEPDAETDPGGARAAGGLPAPYWRVVIVLTGFGLVNFPDALLLLRVRALGFSVAALIGAYVLYNLSYALLSYPAGALSDRWPRHRIFAAGLACFAVAYLGLGLVHTGALVIPLLVIYGGFTAATDGVGKSWVSALLPAGRQGSGQGTYQALAGGAVLVAGIWAGLAWGGTGRLPLLLSGGVAAGIGLLLAIRSPDTPGRSV
ncbi:MAG: MFS transporter [Actinomycetota bacterium]|nr:MFS transporter [Actinomycetota bacterium]